MLPPAHVLVLRACVVHCVCDQVGMGLAKDMLPPAHVLVLSAGVMYCVWVMKCWSHLGWMVASSMMSSA